MSTTELTPPVAAPEPQTAPAAPVRPAAGGAFLTLENAAYIVIALLAIIVHVWDLGNRALHHDETLHAVHSWYIYVGQGYIHDPLLHGPFLYYLGAFQYFLFGDNDFTARLGVAVFGTILVLLPYLIRRELGRTAALSASIYLLISPTFLYVGRLFRHDMYSVVFEMLVFVSIVRYASTHKARWLYIGIAAFALMYTNQETSYLFLLMMGTPLVLLLLWRVYKPGVAVVGALGVALASLVFVLPGEAQVQGGHAAVRDPDTNEMLVAEYGPIFGWGPLETEDNNYALQIRNRPDNLNGNGLLSNLGDYLAGLARFFSHPAILLGIGLLLATIGLLVWLIWLRHGKDDLSAWERAQARGDPLLPAYASLLHGRRWLVALGIFLLIYTLLFTAFFSNLIGVISGTTGSLLYWLAQHNVERGSQPTHYYPVLLLLYESLALLWASIGLVLVGGMSLKRLLRRRAAESSEEEQAAVPAASPLLLPLLLAWWAVTALGIYSWAGEKMPWLLSHVALPLVLLGAWGFQQALSWGFRGEMWASLRRPLIVFFSLFGFIVGMTFVRLTAFFGSDAPANMGVLSAFFPFFEGRIALLTLMLSLVLLVVLVASAGLLRGWRWSLAALALSVTLVSSVYTIRNAYRLNFELGDVPRELLVYTQTSPDVMHVVRRLEDISRLRTNGLEMPIIYDNETVWKWYLRDFTNATATGPDLDGPPGDEVQAVLMLRENFDAQAQEYLQDFQVQLLPLRWWFPQGAVYGMGSNWREADPQNSSLLVQALRQPTSDQTLLQLWELFIHRDPNAPLGSTDFIIAVRPDLSDQIAPGTGAADMDSWR